MKMKINHAVVAVGGKHNYIKKEPVRN
ncbi:unnamed protein product [Acanthoscelides obtectus]|uniref:Uncharacterized protein n=1 Tax=Acanthoscelides obtectus TaxID=200917 RepID=A0A9P0P659_ACAOB|nr:unnamed protein product [Acanthoscelides obtectus]CAH1976755.1 unnamed protein product [Acanthoscelides obtectus]CAH1989294.1 unnamed protein product [Acanthoscelides obtectus]CAH1993656.1 unnamed protein product [Acanthoscelides obtectus]CAK1623653.1 hypothetical protein AOBTE_LOCUS2105 [Acanthoscelides obtectus]